jgi:uncharacterized flavoprotein (TIGR03862 family)
MLPSDAKAAVIGAGPAGLMAAEVLAGQGAQVTVYDRMPSAGRKFLMAGRGGLNLTHSEDLPAFLSRYGEVAPRLRAAIEAFPPTAVRAWCEALGQDTFVGSSGRVFPKALKASPLLRAWLRRLSGAGVEFKFRHRWAGWDQSGNLLFEDGVSAKADAVVLALGGGSWPKLGSDGGWADVLRNSGIAVTPLRPANSGFLVSWSDVFRERFEGQPLKRIQLTFHDHSVRGELLITRSGLEGGAIYALSAILREAIAVSGEAVLHIGLRPELSNSELQRRLEAPRGKQSLATFLRKAVNLSPPAIGLLHEAAAAAGHRLASLDAAALAALIGAVPVRLMGVASLQRAISTAGGVSFADIDEHFMLRRRPGTFAAGEMLDWEAPTGGYLLQASFATGAAAARGALAWLAGAADRSYVKGGC